MPITVANPFKGRHYPGEVILQAVRWYLRYPLTYEHVARSYWRSEGSQWMPVVFGVGYKLTRPN